MLQKLSSLMEGKKTYIGIFITFLGLLGFGHLVTGDELGQLIDLSTQVIGLVVTIYGRRNTKKTTV